MRPIAVVGVAALAGAVGCGGNSTAQGPLADEALTINELMTVNVLSAQDEMGHAVPWIEIHNPGGADASLAGWGVSNDPAKPLQATVPAGVTVPARGYTILWLDGSTDEGPTHLAVTVSPEGGTIALARPDGTFTTQLTYGAQVVDVSAAREPDGSDNWATDWRVSPGAANPDGSGQPLTGAPPETIAAAGDLSGGLLGDDVMPQIELQISDDGIAALRSQPDGWVQATIVYQGRSYGPVGVNLKGTGSFEPIDQKPAFRVSVDKFAKGARLLGIKELLLNNMGTDPTMMRERLGYWLGRQVSDGSVPTSRCTHAWVVMNGTALGLYAAVEEPKAQMIARYFQDPNGPVYTIHYADFAAAYLSNFQLQDGPDDPSLIDGLSTALAMTPADAAMTAAAQYVDLHAFARYWALMVVTGHWGGWPYAPDPQPAGANAGLYADPTSHHLYFIPEGINDMFTTSDFDFIKLAKSVLAKTCAETPSCFQDFAAQVHEILDKADQLDWAGENDRIAAQIATMTTQDTRKPFSDADVAMYQQQLRYFLTGRRTWIDKYLVAPAP
jgi:hypothetical protein